jgi:hypothetical protein
MPNLQIGLPLRAPTADGKFGILAAGSHNKAISVIEHRDNTERLRLTWTCNNIYTQAEKESKREGNTTKKRKKRKKHI